MTKRWSSGVTAYRTLETPNSNVEAAKRDRGLPRTEKLGRSETSTDIMPPARVRKKSSSPLCAQIGERAPPIEISQRPWSTSGNGRTYTSSLPDSSDT